MVERFRAVCPKRGLLFSQSMTNSRTRASNLIHRRSSRTHCHDLPSGSFCRHYFSSADRCSLWRTQHHHCPRARGGTLLDISTVSVLLPFTRRRSASLNLPSIDQYKSFRRRRRRRYHRPSCPCLPMAWKEQSFPSAVVVPKVLLPPIRDPAPALPAAKPRRRRTTTTTRPEKPRSLHPFLTLPTTWRGLVY